MNNLQLLLLFAFLGLSGLGLSAFFVMTGQSKQEKIRQRFEAATTPHLRVRKLELPRVVRTRAGEGENSPVQSIAGLFGANLSRQDQYPVKWYLLVAIMLLIAYVIANLVVVVLGAIGWIAFPVLGVLLNRAAFNFLLMRRRKALYGQFPDCLSMIVRSVRAGTPLAEAIRIVARESQLPSSEEFGRVAGDLSMGVPIQEALTALADRNEITEFRFFATALTLQSQTGGRLGETLENLGSLVRKRMALKARGYALASEARTTAMILGGLPVLSAGALYLLNPAYVNVLFHDPAGQKILAAAIAMLASGAFIMKATIEKSLA
jgi:tight adherence protein B